MQRSIMELILLVSVLGALFLVGQCAAIHGTTSVHWTLNPGLYLSWNAASQFCRQQFCGHLPTTHTQLTWTGIEKVIAHWETKGHYLGEFWIGLYAKEPHTVPEVWEENCAVQPPNVHRWNGSSAGNHGGHKMCVTGLIHVGQMKWRSRQCKSDFAVICQSSRGNCSFDAHPSNNSTGSASSYPPSLSSLNQTTSADLQACSSQCLSKRLLDVECVAVEFDSGQYNSNSNTSTCRLYFGHSLLSGQDVVPGAVAEDTWLRQCFTESVNLFGTSTPFQNIGDNTPDPACPCDATWSTQVPCPTNTSADCAQNDENSSEDDLPYTPEMHQPVSQQAASTLSPAEHLSQETTVGLATTAHTLTNAVYSAATATEDAQDLAGDVSDSAEIQTATATEATTQLTTGLRGSTASDAQPPCPCNVYSCKRRRTTHPSATHVLLTVIPRESTRKYRQRLQTTWSEGTVSQVFLTVLVVAICCLFIAAIVVADVRLMIHDCKMKPTRKSLTPRRSRAWSRED